jgi:hypothetical protein
MELFRCLNSLSHYCNYEKKKKAPTVFESRIVCHLSSTETPFLISTKGT